MKKLIDDFIHLYVGCDAVIDYRPGEGMLIDRVQGIDKRYRLVYTSNGDSIPYENIKLLLRPLSDMTKEEAIRCANIEGMAITTAIKQYFFWIIQDDSYTLRIFDSAPYIELIKDGRICTITKQFEITAYLLSRSFDLFNLIADGLAFDATKI